MPLLWTEAVALIDAERVVVSVGEHVSAARHAEEPAGALGTLLRALPRPGSHRFAIQRRVTVLVDASWIQATMLRWQPGIDTAAAWNNYASALFAEQRVSTAPLSIAIEAAPFGEPRLAVAIETAWLAALAAACEGAGWTFATCRDLLTAAVARHLKALPADCAFALAGRDALTCLFRRDGRWVDVQRQELAADQSIGAALAVAAVLCAQPVGLPVYVSALVPLPSQLGPGITILGAPDARLPSHEAIEAALAGAGGRSAAIPDGAQVAQETTCNP
ncbi:hypothetical protein [Burkholderia ubonensis]|uniref:hypothetical protein n=1 Tax=Burkholderia ubonensis TaxID=101571 RepID=UPI0007527915|nr:hypothetical protein [Burkholderia ubonensis]KWD49512.1 hypothetical protein WL66_20170 [Burkholderia ubonensis]KWD67942.1 hypothetical protein WL67_28315 [Burkholderia ubonensis]